MPRRALFLFALAGSAANSVCAADMRTRVVDGLGRGVPGVALNVRWIQSGKDDGEARRVEVFRGVTDDEGRVHIVYDDTLVPAGEFLFTELEKDGYAGYADSELKSQYVLAKEASQSFAEIAALERPMRADALRELLAADDSEGASTEVFVHEDALRSSLRTLVTDPKVGRVAIRLLSDIGVRSDMEFILHNHPTVISEEDEGYDYIENRWAYSVATALISPDSEAAWEFLESCASGDFDDGWVDAGAIHALSLTGGDRAASVLARVAKRNVARRDWIERLLGDLASHSPPSLANPSIEDAVQALGSALKVGRFQGASDPTLNRGQDKARVDLTYRSGRDLLVYTATYHREGDGLWHLRGVGETMQALMASDDES
jgi:hypothetical protein